MNPRLTLTAAFATIATATALFPLMSGMSWIWPGVGAVAMAAAVGALSRLRTIPAPLCLAAALAAQALYLNAVFSGPRSWARLAPTTGSLSHFSALVSQAMAQMATYAPPVPPSKAVTLIATAGIGVIGAVTDLLAVRLRRPALAGLPLLALFCVPLTTAASAGWIATALVFSVAMAGYLAMLSVDGRERLRLWGHVISVRGADNHRPDTRPLRATGRRVGFAAVVLALFVPLLAPGLRRHPMFSGPGGSGRGAGGSPLALPDPLVQLNRDLHAARPQTVLTYRTADQSPPYLQVYVLDKLTANAWSLAAPRGTVAVGDGPLPPAPGLSPGARTSTVRETIRLSTALSGSPTTLSYLPVPYAPRDVRVPGEWRVDRSSLSLVTGGMELAGLEYTVTSADADPSARQLRAAPGPPAAEAGDLTVPAPFGRLTGLADRITAGRSTAYDKAVALQNWFARPGDFAYSLNAPEPDGVDTLIRFLTTTRRGYCQQFAFGMAVLARLLSIPSRVVVGYTQGAPIGGGAWRVTTSDAHAWPELYFQGAGWLRFEPTPAASPGHPGQSTASTPPYAIARPAAGGPGATRPAAGAQATTAGAAGQAAKGGAVAKLNRLLAGGEQATAAPARKAGASFPAVVVTLAVVTALLLAPAASRLVIRRIRWLRAANEADRAHAAWRELVCDLADLRTRARPSETPRTLARRVLGDYRLPPADRDALERITRAAERARYAASPAPAEGLRDDAAAVRRALGRARGIRGRCVALIAPASVLAPLTSGLAGAMDLFGWLDARVALLPRRLGRRREPAVAPWHG